MISTAEKQRSDKTKSNGKTQTRPSSKPASRIDASPPQTVPSETSQTQTLQSPPESPDQLRVSYARRDLQCEIRAGRYPILTGGWQWEMIVDDRRLDASDEQDTASWENTCWEINIDVAYAEMQLDLPSGIQIQRQILLARRDRFAYLADVVTNAGDIDALYRWRLEMNEHLSCVPSLDAREISLYAGRRAVARVLPISLPEWRRQSGGDLEIGNGLRMTQRIPARCAHVAMLVDLDPQRLKRQLTWRQLTVAESLQAVPRHVAAGYRIQIGKEQWLIYRSLAPKGNRTVLGQNFSTEFVVARFRPNGMADKILEIL